MQTINDNPTRGPVFVSAKDLAARYDVSLRTVHRWVESGLIRGHRIGGGRLVRYRLDEAEAALLGTSDQGGQK